MEKCNLEKLIKVKSDRVTYIQCTGASDVWSHYEKVQLDGEFSSQVRCIPCGALLKLKLRDGTMCSFAVIG